MPYIPDDPRRDILDSLAEQVGYEVDSKGELNFAISRICAHYLLSNKKGSKIRYDDFSDIAGVLTDVEAEFRRRCTNVYEDNKCAENGDVFTELLERIEREKHGKQ